MLREYTKSKLQTTDFFFFHLHRNECQTVPDSVYVRQQ